MGAAASRPAPRALVDAVEGLGGATSAEVLELVDVFARAPPAGHVPVTADDVAALSSRSSRRLRTASEVADAFDLPGRVAAVLSRRVPSVDDATGGGGGDVGGDAVPPAGISLADALVHLARCRNSDAAAVEEADALLRAGALVDLAKTATTATTADEEDDDEDEEVDARAPPLAALRTLSRARIPGAARRFPSLPATARSLLLRSARASLAPRLLTTTTGGGRRRASRDVLTRAGAWLLAASIPSARRRGCAPATWRRVYATADDGAGFSTFVSRITAKTCGPVLVCVRTKAGDVLGGYVSLGPGESVRGDRAEFQGDAGSFVFGFGKAGKKTNNDDEGGGGEVDSAADAAVDDDASEDGDARADDSWTRVGVYPSTGANANYAWCAAGFTSDRFPNGFGFGGVANRAGAGRSAIWIDGTLERGRCVPGIATFAAPMLAGCADWGVESEERRPRGGVLGGDDAAYDDWGVGSFEIDAVEAWATSGADASSAGGTKDDDEGPGGDRGGGVRDAKHGELRMMMQLGGRDAGGPAREER